MIFTLDTEFIDTEEASELISLALYCEDKRELYLEFPYTEAYITPWLAKHVVPSLTGCQVSFKAAQTLIREFVGGYKFERPEFWAYYATYDWYWLSRVMGGFMNFPEHWPMRPKEFADIQQGVPTLCRVPGEREHNALTDAYSLMQALRLQGIVPK